MKLFRLCNTRHCNKGSVYITALIFIFLTALFAAGFLLLTSIEFRHMIRDQWSLTAFHLAEAGVEDAIWALKNLWTTTEWQSAGWTTGTTYTKSVSSFTDSSGATIGDYSVTITSPSSSTPTIESTGYTPSMTADHKIERTIKVGIYTSSGSGNIKAAVNTHSHTKSLGGLIIDGRNHELNDNPTGTYPVIAGTGVLGLYTTDATYEQSGTSKVGGTASSVDYPPDKPGNPAIIQTSAPSYSQTPDEVLGYSVGTLKAQAQSGIRGSQYVTDPNALTTPFSGVTYVEINNDTWNIGGTYQIAGTGILIVHSSTGNTANIQNLNQNAGTFKGLLIADHVETIHNDIIGAVITLTSSNPTPPPSGVDCIGNGEGRVLYSSEAINKAFWATGGMGITSWQEK